MTAMVCEALSYYSMKDVTPNYYEVALKEKYTRDEDVKSILEIVRDGAQMDFTFAYSTLFEPFFHELPHRVPPRVSRREYHDLLREEPVVMADHP